MLINNINISNFNAKFLKANISNQELSNISTWNLNSLNPIFFRNNKGFKKVELEILFKGGSREEILRNISNFMSKLLNEVDLTLDTYSNKFKVILSENETEKTVSSKAYIKKLIFLGYEFGVEVTESMNRTLTKTIKVNGNTETPAIVEITPSVALVDLTIKGLDEDPIIIKNLEANKKIILDGEKSKITVDGTNKYKDTDMWNFPRLVPGSNIITVDKNSCDITIKYKPRFL